jgi:choline dehydrogenase-like flavoprotein
MDKTYDAIIVGTRCAGSPTAMLLARKGDRVLLLVGADRRERASRSSASQHNGRFSPPMGGLTPPM